LSDFSKADQPWLDAVIDAVARNAGALADGEPASFQNHVHMAMDDAGFVEKKPPKKKGGRPQATEEPGPEE
jgi:PTH1 family peptidyl-tRNA hydrolase